MKSIVMPTTALLIGIVLCIAFHMIFPIQNIFPPKWNLLGLIPLLFGIWINLTADQELKNAETTVKPYQESNTLVCEGAYRISRNPMYLGFVSILIGISVLFKIHHPIFSGCDFCNSC